MRLTWALFRNAREPQNPNKVPFKALTPLKLKDYVSSKYRGSKEKGCLHEMTLLLTCLEDNDLEDKRCIPEIQSLNQCYKNYVNNIENAKRMYNQKVVVPGSKNLTPNQITHLIRSYPTV